jgi:transcriptional regulator with XRE-family HTH domain
MSRKSSKDEYRQKLFELAIFLRELRLNAGYTQGQVSEKINAHRNTISRIENNHNFSVMRLYQLSDFYNIPVHQFFCI